MRVASLFVCLCATTVLGLYSSSDDVVQLNPSNFQDEVLKSDQLYLVEFYAPWCGHCKNLAPEWKKAATALKGIVNIGAVDAQEHSQLGGQYDVKGFPTIKFFGANKKKPEDYSGGRTADAIVEFAMQQATKITKARLKGGSSSSGEKKESKDKKQSGGGGGGKSGGKDAVVELTSANFEDEVLGSDDVWLVEFFAPWCGHCKNLAPEWKKAAAELSGKVKLGAIDATIEGSLAQKYGIQGYPTIKVWKGGPKGDPSDYQGGRTASDIVRYALNLYEANAPPPEVHQLLSNDGLTEHCGTQTCVIAFLPHILDVGAAVRNEQISVIKKAAEKSKSKPFVYLWAEAMQQPGLEEAVAVGGFGYPAVTALNLKKSKYVTMVRAFNSDNLVDFLKDLSSGKAGTAPIVKLPTLATVEAWDGKGEAPKHETFDDLDLDV